MAIFFDPTCPKWIKLDQLILKCLFGTFNSPKKRMKKFYFSTTVPRSFLEELKTQKDISKLTDL